MTFIGSVCGLESSEKEDNPSLAYPLLRTGLEGAIVRCINEIQDGDSEPPASEHWGLLAVLIVTYRISSVARRHCVRLALPLVLVGINFGLAESIF
jgi:hypothetical protein